MKYECFIKPGFRCAEVEAASAEEAADFFVSTIVDNLGPEHVVVNNLETEAGNDPSPNGTHDGRAIGRTVDGIVGNLDGGETL